MTQQIIHHHGVNITVRVEGEVQRKPVTIGQGWHKIQVVCMGKFSLDEECQIVEGLARVWGPVLSNWMVTNDDPLTAWDSYVPWDIVQVHVCARYLRWWQGWPAGIAPWTWNRRREGLRPLAVWVGITDDERRSSGLEYAWLRAAHECVHCYLNHMGTDGDHTDDPKDLMYRSGVRLGARMSDYTRNRLLEVQP